MSAIIHNHMEIPWEEYLVENADIPITEADLKEKSALIGRVGLELLSCGTGAWRVRSSMNSIARVLDISCTVDIGLMSLTYTCFDGTECVAMEISLPNAGVNTAKLTRLEEFIRAFPTEGIHMTGSQIHEKLEALDHISGLYNPIQLGLASALACCGFTFLLGGGPWEMLLAFIGAGVGNFVRSLLLRKHFTLFMNVAVSVAAACLAYDVCVRILEMAIGLNPVHEAGYICAMLFIIPGFPFITSGIDLAKLDIRSGLERLCYALIIIGVATLTGWIMALILGLAPQDFEPLGLSTGAYIVLRLITSFAGVFGFSLMFNSPTRLAARAGFIGAIANTLRLDLVDLAAFPPGAAAFCGAMTAGLLASLAKKRMGYPRIAITVPSIVIMVPGLYLYKGIYHLGMLSLDESASWIASAALIVAGLPLGLIAARILTDKSFRICS